MLSTEPQHAGPDRARPGQAGPGRTPPAPDNFDEAVLAREVQRGALEVAPGVHLRAVLDELVDDVSVSAIAGEVQGREAVAVCLVGISPTVEVQPAAVQRNATRKAKENISVNGVRRTLK